MHPAATAKAVARDFRIRFMRPPEGLMGETLRDGHEARRLWTVSVRRPSRNLIVRYVESAPGGSTTLGKDNQPRRQAMRFLSMIRIEDTSGQKPSERLVTHVGQLMEEA